jgi:phosphomannomutase
MFTSRDIRGIYGKDITISRLNKLSAVLNDYAPELTIGMDYRARNHLILETTIAYYNGQIRYLGNVPTPVVPYLTQELGLCITASHNPPEYNGIKFFIPGCILDPTELEKLRALYSDKEKSGLNKNPPKKTDLTIEEDLVQRYLSAIPEILDGIFDLSGGAACRFKRIFPNTIFDKPDPTFQTHSPEPKDATLEYLKLETKRFEKVGYVFDGDADRVAVVADGQLIPGDILIGYVAEYYLRANDKLILSLDCSQEVFQYIKDLGRQPIYAPVGQNLLIAEAKKQNAAFIGEYSGHYSFNEFMYYSDPFYFVGVVSEVQPSDLLSFQAQFHNVILRERVQGKIEYRALQEELEQWADQLILIDGIKAILEEEEAAILIRHSQSEPITRINVEAKTLKTAHQLFEKIQRLLKKISELKGE